MAETLAVDGRREPWNPLLKSYPDSEKINAISIGAETLFTRLIAKADDYGNYWGSPKMLTAKLFPHRWKNNEVTPTDVGKWRAELVNCPKGPLAAIYAVNGEEYIHIISPRRKLREDVKPEIKVPREPENIEEQAISVYVTSTVRPRFVQVPLDQTRPNPEETRQLLVAKGDPLNKRMQKHLDYLNEATGRSGTSLFTSGAGLLARLRGGATDDDIRIVIDCKAAQWGDNEKMAKWIRPKTLFGKDNFPGYLSEARGWEAKGKKPFGKKQSNPSAMGHDRGAGRYERKGA